VTISPDTVTDLRLKPLYAAAIRIGTESGTLVTEFTFQPDGSGEQKGSTKFCELLEALPVDLGYQHASILARRVLCKRRSIWRRW
jgi:hypothetical protein